MTSTRTTSISIGTSRVGKTHFIGTIADCGKLFILDTEDGLRTIEDKKFDYVTANTWQEAMNVLNWYMEEGYKKYTHFALDSLNRLQVYLIDAVVRDSGSVVKDKNNNPVKDSNQGQMTMNKWGIVTAQTKKIVDLLTKVCPSSVHMNVTAMESKDEVTGITKLYPALSGAFKHEALGYFDSILYHRAAIDSGVQKFWIQLGADGRIDAGTRLQSVKKMYGAVMPNDYACIHNTLTSSNDTTNKGE